MYKNTSDVIVFNTLAMNQTLFYEALSHVFENHGYRVAFICFHERSHDYLRAKGILSLNVFKLGVGAIENIRPEDFGINNLNLILSHEKATFEIHDTRRILYKLKAYLLGVTRALDEIALKSSGRMFMVQELGGFASIIAAYHAVRTRGMDNVFIEPSFFKGRVFFVKNSFSALPVPGPNSLTVSNEVNNYLDHTIQSQSIVLPTKDIHHYRAAAKKILNLHNMRRLVEKFKDKYVGGYREEFTHIGGHVARHFRMAINSQRLKRYYQPKPPRETFIYYPLHVPTDVALTLRSPEYFDQYTLVDFLCRTVPYPCKVVIKEHPALVGALDYTRTRGLLAQHDNLVLLDARLNNYQVLQTACAVVTVNSKSGAEGLLIGKPVIVLGDAFYRTCQLVHAVGHLGELPERIEVVLKGKEVPDKTSIRRYFQDVWNHSYPGELYVATRDNAETFTNSLLCYLAKHT